MNKEEIFNYIKDKYVIEISYLNGASIIIDKCDIDNSENLGLWKRKIWGVTGYISNEQMTEEILEGFNDKEIEYIM